MRRKILVILCVVGILCAGAFPAIAGGNLISESKEIAKQFKQKLTVSPGTLSMKVGQSKPLKVTAQLSKGKPIDVTNLASYLSNSTVATVYGGVVTAVYKGDAFITVSYGDLVEKVKVKVKEKGKDNGSDD